MLIKADMYAAGGEKSIEDLSYVTFLYQNNGNEYFGWFDEGYSEGDYKEDVGKVLSYQSTAILDFSIATFNFTKVGNSGTITYKVDCLLLDTGTPNLKTKGTTENIEFNSSKKFKLFGIKE